MALSFDLLVQPGGVARGFLRPAPFFQHLRRNTLQLGHLFRCAGIAGQFQTVAIGIEEIDRAEDAVIGWADDVGNSKNASTLPFPASRKMCM